MISISIHALRKESDLDVRNITRDDGLFQSTLSVRRATGVAGDLVGDLRISIHALRKESDTARAPELAAGAISIHALRKESDHLPLKPSTASFSFQSTLSVRRATRQYANT